MGMNDTRLVLECRNWAKPTRYNVFLELFAILPLDRLAQRLVNRFASQDIEIFVQALQKELNKTK